MAKYDFYGPQLLGDLMAYGVYPSADIEPHLRGGFAEYMYVFPNSVLFKIPEKISFI